MIRQFIIIQHICEDAPGTFRFPGTSFFTAVF